MQEPEILGVRAEFAPMRERGLEQDIGTNNIGGDEIGGPVDRTIDMALRRQMHDRVRIETRKNVDNSRPITDIGKAKMIPWMTLDRSKRGKIAGVGQLVDDKHLVIAMADEMPDQRRSDEPCSARDHNPHAASLPLLELLNGQRRKWMAVVGKRTDEFLQQRKSPILIGSDDVRVLERPWNSNLRVIPADATVTRGRVIIRDLVHEYDVILQGEVSMCKAHRNVNLPSSIG